MRSRSGRRCPRPVERAVAELLASPIGSKRADLGGGVVAVREYDRLWLEPAARAAGPPGRWGGWTIEPRRPGLHVRGWRAGDRLAGCDRKVQDVFVDAKIPRSEREAWPLVVRGDSGSSSCPAWSAAPGYEEAVVATEDCDMTSASEQSPAVEEVLVDEQALAQRVLELGAEISADYAGRDLLLVGVLKGAVFFIADLMRSITVPCEIDFMAISSYGSATDSSGVVRILKDLDVSIEGRNVLVVEDIVDSGLTLSYLIRTLRARQPASLEVCALLTKPARRRIDVRCRYVGFEIPPRVRDRVRARFRGAVSKPALRGRAARRARGPGRGAPVAIVTTRGRKEAPATLR